MVRCGGYVAGVLAGVTWRLGNLFQGCAEDLFLWAPGDPRGVLFILLQRGKEGVTHDTHVNPVKNAETGEVGIGNTCACDWGWILRRQR